MSSYHSKMITSLTAGIGGECVVFSKSQGKIWPVFKIDLMTNPDLSL